MEGNVYEPNSSPVVHVSIFNSKDKIMKSELSYKLYNYRGNVIHTGAKNVSLRQYSTGLETINLPELDTGYYSCEFVVQDGEKINNYCTGIVVIPARPTRKPNRPFLGYAQMSRGVLSMSLRLWVHKIQVRTYQCRIKKGTAGLGQLHRLLG